MTQTKITKAQSAPVQNELLRPKDAAAILAISLRSLYGLMQSGQIGFVRVLSDRRIPRAELLRFIERLEVVRQERTC